MMLPEHRFLVIVRAGDKSLHRRWLEGGQRNWDLVVSWYDDSPYEPVSDETVLMAKGWKWDVLATQFAANPQWLDHYDLIFAPDDDIEADAGRISAMFEIADAHHLTISQPGLSSDSYFSHIHTLASRSFLLRYTNFVECMAPCMTPSVIRKMLPYLPLSPSGFGLDYIWGRLEPDNRQTAAIIDATPMRHTRPVGRFFASRLVEAGVDFRSQGHALVERFGVSWKRSTLPCYGGISRSGRRRGRCLTALSMLVDWWCAAPDWVQPNKRVPYLRTLRGIFGHTDLSQVRDTAARWS